MSHLRRRLAFIVLLILVPLVIGTIGYIVIDGYPPLDAIYMAVITVATVGYSELRPLSTTGRIFNIFVIMTGATALLLAVGAMTQTIIELELKQFFPKRRVKRMIDSLTDHLIICGYGRVGRNAANELLRADVPFIILEKNEDKVDRAMRSGLLAALGDATLDASLRGVGIDRARGLIASLATDADNLFLVLSAKTLNPRLQVSVRVNEEEAEQKMRRAGADTILAPFMITGARLAQSILRPHVVQFLDFTTMNIGLQDVSIEQARVAESSEYVARSLRDMQVRREMGVIVLAIRKADGDMIFNPAADTRLAGGDYLIAMGKPEQLRQLERMLGVE